MMIKIHFSQLEMLPLDSTSIFGVSTWFDQVGSQLELSFLGFQNGVLDHDMHLEDLIVIFNTTSNKF